MGTQETQYKSTNALAVASFVVALLWFGGLGSVVAIVLGYKAREEIRHTGQPGQGLATAGLVLGWIGIVVSALLLVTVAGFISRTTSDSVGPGGSEFDRVSSELNAESALEDAAAAQRSYFEEHGTYTTDVGVLTQQGQYLGVRLSPVHANDEGFCVEAIARGLKRPRHTTESSNKPQRGPCLGGGRD